MERGLDKRKDRTRTPQDMSGANHKSPSATPVSTQTIQLANSTDAHSKDRSSAVLVPEEGAGRG